jgi:hypothetical protein
VKNKWWLIVFVTGYIVFGRSLALADDDTARYSEYKTPKWTVRYTEGPGEMASIGSYAIHIYDSEGIGWVAGIIKPRDGSLGKAWVTKGNRGNELRIWVWLETAGSGRYGKLDLIEFDGKSLRTPPTPEPDKSMLKGYMGHDDYSVVEGMVYRQFPLYLEGDSNAGPSGGMRCLEMNIEKMKWNLSNHKIK